MLSYFLVSDAMPGYMHKHTIMKHYDKQPPIAYCSIYHKFTMLAVIAGDATLLSVHREPAEIFHKKPTLLKKYYNTKK